MRGIEKVRSGEVSFDTWARATARDWRRLAEHLFRRYPLPAALSVEDVEQEMLLAAWTAIRTWDPSAGMPLERFVTWTAYINAKKWVHRQRNALRRDDRAPGRFPSLMTLGDYAVLRSASTASDAAEVRARVAGAIRALEDSAHRVAVTAVASAGGDLDAAADLLLGDPGARTSLGILTRSDAARLVRDATAASRMVAA
jgi:DNA-directed RNA polymerase specialized sigma24 family protein